MQQCFKLSKLFRDVLTRSPFSVLVQVNARDGTGRTALHVAAGAKVPDSLSALLGAGADLEARNCAGHAQATQPTGLAIEGGRNSV